MIFKESVYVVDTCAFIGGLTQLIGEVKLYTVPEVIKELENNSIMMELVSKGLQESKILVKAPSEESLNNVLNVSLKTGDSIKLSLTDLKLIALGRDLSGEYDVIIVSDDYSIQNICVEIGVKFKNLREGGIRRQIKWVKYCPACFREESKQDSIRCEVCGTALKVKPAKRLGKDYGGKYKRSG